jgi:hypothetical protein
VVEGKRTSPFGTPLAPFIETIERLLDGELDCDAFETQLRAQFLAEDFPWPRAVFEILDSLLASADLAQLDPGNSWAVTPEQLLDEAREALNELREYKYLL